MGKSVFRRGDTLKGVSNGAYFLSGVSTNEDKSFITAIWLVEKDEKLYIVNNTELSFPDGSGERLQTIDIVTREQFDSIGDKLKSALTNRTPYYNEESKMLKDFFGDTNWDLELDSRTTTRAVNIFIESETVFKIPFEYQGFKDLGNDWYEIFYKNDNNCYVLNAGVDVIFGEEVLHCDSLEILDEIAFDERSFGMDTSDKIFDEFKTSDFDKNEIRIFPKQTFSPEVKISINGKEINDIFEIDIADPGLEEEYERDD